MNPSALFIRRPIMTTLVMVALLFGGVIGQRSLPVSELPDVDFPTLQVSAGLPGASPETMASAVATPLERQFSTIAGLRSMTSNSTEGFTSVTLQFVLERDIDAAAVDVQAAITQAERDLPPELPSPPSYRKVNPAEQPILYLGLRSATLPLSRVHEYGDRDLAQRLSTVPGVAEVQVFGAQKYAVRVQVDPGQLASRGISFEEVERAVRAANVNLPTGTVQGRHRAFTVEATGQLAAAEAYRPVIVAWREGAPVRLRELGRVIDGVENDETATWFDDRRAVVLAVRRQPGANTVEVVAGIRRVLGTARAALPAALDVQVVYDRAESIREAVRDVQLTLLLAVVMVVLVIFLFLTDLGATAIASVAVPLSLVGSFGPMALLGYSVDTLSLMALTLSVGFVVDDAIVVLENVVRHAEEGQDRRRAALEAAGQIAFTIVSMTLSLVAVFIPVLFMAGIIGRLLREFAVTISVALLLSGVVSLTLTPMLASRFLRKAPRRGRLLRGFGRGFARLGRGYDRTLGFSLGHRRSVLAIFLLTLAGTGYLLATIPKGFIPSRDADQLIGFLEADAAVSFEAMTRLQGRAAAVLRADPRVRSIVSSVGGAGPGGARNAGFFFVRLIPRGERVSAEQVMASLRPRLAEIPGLRVYLQQPQAIALGGQLTRALYQYTLQSTDPRTLYRWADRVSARLRTLPQLRDVNSTLELANPQVMVRIDRDRSAALGVSVAAIETALFDAFGDRQVSTIYAPSNTYQVILEVGPEHRRDPEALHRVYVASTAGPPVRLDAVARFEQTVGPLAVGHVAQLPAVTISFNLPPKVSLGDALEGIAQAERELQLPETISGRFLGAAEEFRGALGSAGPLLGVALLVIYLLLGILYESFIHPLTILSGLPSALLGGLLSLRLFGRDLDFFGMVGLLLLVGIVKKNAIMMIDFALDAERRGAAPREAILQGAGARFRPIMMTTLSTIAGILPIALGLGAGGEVRRPLGLVVVGGLILSQLVTLYLTPVLYLGFGGAARRLRGRWHRERPGL